MPAKSYESLDPIARALDRVGDRWTLLILRDLHAGPARFIELSKGLTGIASNLLTKRLAQLQEDGLIAQREGAHGVTLYALTERGEATAPVLDALAAFGAGFAPPESARAPGNLRSAAVILRGALGRVAPRALDLRVELRLDGEPFDVHLAYGAVRVSYQRADAPEAVLELGYEPMMALSLIHI